MKTMVKAGKLANGAERGKGKIVHLVPDENSYAYKSLCGEVPAIQWSDRPDLNVTCKKCLKLVKNV